MEHARLYSRKQAIANCRRGHLPSESGCWRIVPSKRILKRRTMHCMILVSLMLLVAMPVGSNAANTPDQKQKAILVTGASTGIGRKITERLAAHGYFVYAGARKETDLQALGAIPNVRAVRLDVTRPEDIVAAVEFVTKGGRGLYGLVNNAGIYT